MFYQNGVIFMFLVIRSSAASAVLVLFCVSCSTPVYKPAAAETRQQITSTAVVIAIPEHEIYATIVPIPIGTRIVTGGVVSHEVEKYRTEIVEAGIDPLRSSLLDYDFDDVFQNDLQRQLSGVTWLHLNGASIVKDASRAYLDRQIGSCLAPYCLIVKMDYHLTHDFTTLIMSAHPTLFARNPKPIMENGQQMNKEISDSKNILYTANFSYHFAIPIEVLQKLKDQVDSKVNNVVTQSQKGDIQLSDIQYAALDYWMKNNDMPVKYALAQGATELSHLIADNMMHGLPEVGVHTERVIVDDKLVPVISHEGSGRILVLLDDGSILSTDYLSGAQPVTGAAPTKQSAVAGGGK